MQLLMEHGTERHGELVRDLAAHGVWLGEGQVVGLGAVLAADDTAVADDELQVIGIAQALRLGERQGGLVDATLADRFVWGLILFGFSVWLCFGIFWFLSVTASGAAGS